MAHYSTSIEVAWADCDPFGIIFYPHYFRFMDIAFHRLLGECGHTHHTLRESAGIDGMPIVEAGAKFISPITYGDTLSLAVQAERAGERRMRFSYRGETNGRPVLEAFERRAFVRRTAGGIEGTDAPAHLAAALLAATGV